MGTISGRADGDSSAWKDTWRYVAGVGACLFIGYFAFVRGTRVPLLGWADLGFHELGHMIMYPLPVGDLLTAAAGSALQVLVPAGLAVYFLAARRDLLGAGLCMAWTAASFHDVSVYVADAPFERLALIGGEHDWAYLLGPRQFDTIDAAAGIASSLRATGIVLLLAGIGVCIGGLLVDWTPKPSKRAIRVGSRRPAHQPVGAAALEVAATHTEAVASEVGSRPGNILPQDGERPGS